MITKVYTLPLVGKVQNWETFSGDPNDPVRVVAPGVFHRQWLVGDGQGGKVPPPGVPVDEAFVNTTLLSINADGGTAEVEITAHEQFHAGFEVWLKSASLADKQDGKPSLKRPIGSPMPQVSLTFK